MYHFKIANIVLYILGKKQCIVQILKPDHGGRMNSKTIHSTIDVPQGVPGVSKNQKSFFTKKLSSFSIKITPIRHKL